MRAAPQAPTILGRPAPRLPPVFGGCTQLVIECDQQAALDAYWEVVVSCGQADRRPDACRLLEAAVAANPYVAEPHVLLAQAHLHSDRPASALPHAEAALRLALQWGTAWDKRLSWDAWVAWVRVLLHAARSGVASGATDGGVVAGAWPAADKPFGMINLGMVPDLGY
ncbi:hypothetical protein FOA52_009029 [Chlamydomonas sp. UWO 241]|nr:hypothetical protein FOA52_009029 [Chlamydomonas sp. UWO 241]